MTTLVGKPKMDTKAVRQAVSHHVNDHLRRNEAPGLLVRDTIPGLCDEVDYLRARVAELESTEPKARFYGSDGTIHRTGYLDVETYNGSVIAVWFRCQMLPFQQSRVDETRCHELSGDFHDLPEIHGLELADH